MNDAHITIIGWLAANPICRTTSGGVPVSSLRVGCTPRRFDKSVGQWQDMPSMFITVNCWRGLADNVRVSDMKLGQPVIITGRLRIREYVRGEELRQSVEIEATTLGYDMSRGTSRFEKVSRGGEMTEDDLREVRESTDQWASSAGPAPAQQDPAFPTDPFATPASHPGDEPTPDPSRDDEDPFTDLTLEPKAA